MQGLVYRVIRLCCVEVRLKRGLGGFVQNFPRPSWNAFVIVLNRTPARGARFSPGSTTPAARAAGVVARVARSPSVAR